MILVEESTDTTTPTAVVYNSVDAFLIIVATVGALNPEDTNSIVLYAFRVDAVHKVLVPALVGLTTTPICLKSLSVGKSPDPSAYSNLELRIT